MINLMPDEVKLQLRAARNNVLLMRYITVIFFAALFLGTILIGSYYLLEQTRISAQKLIDANDTKAEVYSTTKAQVDALGTSLSGTKAILDQEIPYSTVLMRIAQQMPPGTVLEKLDIDAASFTGTPLTLKIYAKTTNDTVTLRDAFQSSPYFNDVNFQAVSDGSAGIAGYPITATLTLTLNRTITQ